MWIPVISCILYHTYISTVCLFEVENAFDVIDMLWNSLSSGYTKYIALQCWMENSILSNRNVKAELWFPWRRKNVWQNISIWRDFNQSIRNTWERMGKGQNRKLILLVVCEKIIKIFNVFFLIKVEKVTKRWNRWYGESVFLVELGSDRAMRCNQGNGLERHDLSDPKIMLNYFVTISVPQRKQNELFTPRSAFIGFTKD